MFLLILVTTLLAWLVVRQYRKISRLPPGPLSFPLIGNLPQIGYYLWKTGGIVPMFDLMRKRYGNIFTLWLGPIPHVSIADYETSHEVFVKNGSKFADKFAPAIFQEMRNDNGVIITNGERWQEMRRFSLLTFRNMGVGRDLMETRIMEELNARCADIDKKAVNGVTVAQAADFFDLTVGSIINSILVGKRFEEDTADEFHKMKAALDDSMDMLTPLDLAIPTWIFKTFFRSRFEKAVHLQELVKDYAAREAVERLKEIEKGTYTVDPNNLKDFADSFILKMQQESEKKDSVYTLENLKCMLIDLWATGQETTTTTLISGFNQLLLHPQVMDKARKELLSVTDNGKRSLSLTDKNSTPYFNAMIGEIQRHASILNVSFWKINHEFTYMGGHPVDAGAFVTAQLSALHANDDIFEHPEKFDPERFMENEKLLQQVIPFGVGKRSCLGEALARAELYLIFGNLLLRYNFKPYGKPSTVQRQPFGAAKRPFKLGMQFVKICIQK